MGMKRVLIPSLFIIYPPNSRKHLERSFLCFFTFPYRIKEKSMATLAKPQHFANTNAKSHVSSPTVSQDPIGAHAFYTSAFHIVLHYIIIG